MYVHGVVSVGRLLISSCLFNRKGLSISSSVTYLGIPLPSLWLRMCFHKGSWDNSRTCLIGFHSELGRGVVITVLCSWLLPVSTNSWVIYFVQLSSCLWHKDECRLFCHRGEKWKQLIDLKSTTVSVASGCLSARSISLAWNLETIKFYMASVFLLIFDYIPSCSLAVFHKKLSTNLF